MIVAKEIKVKYEFYEPYIQGLGQKANETLFTFCEKKNFAYTWRYKSLDSLSEKIETGRFKSWDRIDDLFAATIIIPEIKYEAEVLSFLRKVFKLVKLKKIGSTQKSPDVFRFDTTRGIFMLKSPSSGEKSEIYQIIFEIQIKTAFEHAWSVATHSLGYKTNEIDWNMLRLVSQLKSSVEQLDMLVSGSKQIYKHITKHKWPDLETKLKLLNFIKAKLEKKQIPEELAPKDLSRLCDNFITLIKCSRDYQHRKASSIIKKILNVIDSEILLFDDSNFPRSVSLFQLFFGIMVKHQLLTPQIENFTPLITSELEIIFPEVKEFDAKFIF